MERDEANNELAKFWDLVRQYPDLTEALVYDVLAQCGQDHEKAYELICEMVIPPEQSNDGHASDSTESDRQDHNGPVPKAISAPRSVQYAYPDAHNFPPEYESIYQLYPTPSSEENAVTTSESIPRASSTRAYIPSSLPTPAPQGAWAKKSMGRTYRVDEMCNRYKWMARSTIEALFEKYRDCLELVEGDILEMFPIDEPAGFAGGDDPVLRNAPMPSPSNNPTRREARIGQSARQRAIAESLRTQDAAQIQRDSLASETISSASKGMSRLRQQLWEARETRAQMQQLANQTRKPIHIAQAKDKENELRRLSEYFLARMRQSEEYRNGDIDLHGLTKEESLQLVEWKLHDTGKRRFRIITGKGIHSHNAQAVLRPALVRYFQEKCISYSMYEDGIVTVIP